MPPDEPPTPTAPPDNIAERQMTFGAHLQELQRRLWVSVAVIGLCTIASLVFYQELFRIIRLPAEELNQEYRRDPAWQQLKHERGQSADMDVIPLIGSRMLSTVVMVMWLAVWVGLLLASPLWLYELWAFVSPGLRPEERRAVQPVLLGGVVFFAAGVLFCWYCVVPYVLRFSVWFTITMGVLPWFSIDDYMSLLFAMLLISGLIFEAPVAASIFARLGLLKPWMLTKWWRGTVLGCFVLGALLSPGQDPISMLILSGALLGLYVVSLGATVVFSRRRATALAAKETKEGL